MNVHVHGYEVDALFEDHDVIVELDGYEFHKGRGKFHSDRLQDTKLQLADCMTIRVTQPRIEDEPRELLGDVRRGLSRGAASGR
jgi:very-short-patch-repair endonuclease